MSNENDESENIKKMMSEILKQPVQKLTDDAGLNDLVNDSFLLVDMVIEMQDELDVILMQEDFRRLKTVGDLVSILKEKKLAQTA